MSTDTTHFVLVHGAFHGAWCWYKTVDLLRKSGRKVTAVDLGGAGIHPGNPATINTFERYNEPLTDLLSSLDESEKVVLVGHSLGGLNITHAAELFPWKISLAVYVAAVMMPLGLQSEADIDRVVSKGFDLVYSFDDGPNGCPSVAPVFNERFEETFYTNCPSSDKILASLLARPMSLGVLSTAKITSTVHGYGMVPRVYIKAEDDRCLTPEKQQDFIDDTPPDKIFRLGCDHCPFLSMPEEFHQLLLDIADLYSSPTSVQTRALPAKINLNLVPDLDLHV